MNLNDNLFSSLSIATDLLKINSLSEMYEIFFITCILFIFSFNLFELKYKQ